MKRFYSSILLTVIALFSVSAFAATRTFSENAVELNGTKFWLPSTLVVKKGDHVVIHLVNKLPGASSVHGFELSDFNLKEVVTSAGKTVEFDANKAGIFPFDCQLHPAHVGGELVVLE